MSRTRDFGDRVAYKLVATGMERRVVALVACFSVARPGWVDGRTAALLASEASETFGGDGGGDVSVTDGALLTTLATPATGNSMLQPVLATLMAALPRLGALFTLLAAMRAAALARLGTAL